MTTTTTMMMVIDGWTNPSDLSLHPRKGASLRTFVVNLM